MANEQHFLDELLMQIEKSVESYTETAYEQLVDVLGPAFIALVSLYIIVQGVRLYLGRGEHTPLSYVRQTLILTFITILAMNWNWFSMLVVDLVMRGPDTLIGGLIPNNSSEESVKGFFAKFFDESLAVFIEIFQEGGWRNLSAYLVGVVGGIAVLILIVAMFLLLVSAEVLLSVLLVLAPFIIPLYMFEPTRHICMSWVRMLVSTMFIPILVYAISGLFTDILNAQLESIKGGEVDYYNLASYVVVVIICTLLLRQVPALASGIGGGITAATPGPDPMPALKWGGNFAGQGIKAVYNSTLGKAWGKSKAYLHNRSKSNYGHEDNVNPHKPDETTSSIIILPSRLSGYGSKH
jgi:type IV secretion system protein VirB6